MIDNTPFEQPYNPTGEWAKNVCEAISNIKRGDVNGPEIQISGDWNNPKEGDLILNQAGVSTIKQGVATIDGVTIKKVGGDPALREEGDVVVTENGIKKVVSGTEVGFLPSAWRGKSLCTYGDSITQQNQWQPFLNKILGFFSVSVDGFPGYKVSGNTGLNSYTLINGLPDTDLLLFMGGTNDWANNVALGITLRANIINKDMDHLAGHFINWDTGIAQANSVYDCSEFYFPVEPTTAYTMKNVNHFVEYSGTSEGAYVTGTNNGSGDEVEITTNAATTHIRVSGRVDDHSSGDEFRRAMVYKTSDVTEFKGACSIALERLRLEHPNTFVVAMGCPFGKYQDRSQFTNKYGLINNEGLTTADYSEALGEVARAHGVPFIDIAGGTGWGDTNIVNYVGFDGALLHPNSEGGKLMANVIAGSLISLQPISE